VERVWEVMARLGAHWGFVPMSREEFFLMGKGNEDDPQARIWC